jgi:hypothetical protein
LTMSTKRFFSSRRWAAVAVIALLPLFMNACSNPFDPLNETAEIRGLKFIDFTAAWSQWDSDPEFDGVIFSFVFNNEFGEGLSFKNKPTNILIEYYISNGATFGELLFSDLVTIKNSDDRIRVPKELYIPKLAAKGIALDADVSVFIMIHVFPPKELPQKELVVGKPNLLVYKPPTGITPNP